jgi:acylphosphatase
MSLKIGLRKSAIIVKNIAEYMTNKKIRREAHYRNYPDGSVAVFFEGAEIEVNEFYEMFPLQLLPLETKGANPCKKFDYIHQPVTN